MDPARREEGKGGLGPVEHKTEEQTPPWQAQYRRDGLQETAPPQQQGQTNLPPPSSYLQNNTPLPSMSSMHPSPAGSIRQPHDQPPPDVSVRPPPPPGQSQNDSFSLPGIHGPGQPMASQAEFERERERDMQEARMYREFEERSRQERIECERRQQQEREQPPQHQGHADSAQIHQPVAVAPPGATPVHGPNGILAGATGPQGNPPQFPVAPPQPSGTPGQVPLFAPPHQEGTPRPGQPHPSQVPHTMIAFNGTPQAHSQAPPGAQGQQPILNDALSYLDQVKVQFQGQSDVYNHFLDIMKDFKSQAIDTPGVIRRVSQLFAGNSALIQGFNTFLPSGYRIECNADGNPDGIRVLTPQGHFIDTSGNQIQSGGRGGGFGDDAGPFNGVDRSGGAHPDDTYYSPHLRPEDARGHRHLSPFEGSVQRDNHHANVNDALLAHQQEHRGVAQLQSAANASDQGQMPVSQNVSPLMQGATLTNGLGLAQGQSRGPVEFNHAISYVNKIKVSKPPMDFTDATRIIMAVQNRFTGQPEIYKNFLEILQTYQRESRPIQDVYGQVTSLFSEAPDLLRDFKQFLPDTSAHTKPESARMAAEEFPSSHMRSEPERAARQTPKPEQSRLPPMGNFHPTPTANKDTKRKRGDRGGPPMANLDFGSSRGHSQNKRAKQTQPQPQPVPKQQVPVDTPAVEPTLIPALPFPMEPATTTQATTDELQFFDKVKKHLGNKSTMSDWLKLCNLYSQDLIDVNTLVYRAADFIGDSNDLFGWFKNFVQYTGKDQIIENRARPDSGRVSLNNCRGYGPSYRLLPKRDRQAVCSGRDELCNQVLNDAWASHPTWASEDSGFIAHRKNVHEEGLHRIEEERHDYDHHISVCERAIQILEPIAQQIANTPREQLPQMRLGQDFTVANFFVFKTTLSKIYSRDHATMIIDNLPDRPASVVPVILLRMRQKLEEWKMVQREWEKVWRDQTQKMFWKSLDHQAAAAKHQDKRQFQPKTLQNEIQVKLIEAQNARDKRPGVVPYQMKFEFMDKDVLFDASSLLLTFAEHRQASESSNPARIHAFIKDFIPAFFEVDEVAFKQRMQDVIESTTPDDEMEDGTPPSEASAPSRTRKPNGKKDDLRRDVLDKSRKPDRADREGSTASVSRASTPDVTSTVEEDAVEAADAAAEEVEQKTWFNHPVEGNIDKKHPKNVKPEEPFKRNIYNLYGNLNIYCFFKIFVTLYERLLALKSCEKDVQEAINRERKHKPAMDFNIIDRKPTDFFSTVGPNTNYYEQVVGMLEEVAKGNTDSVSMGQVEELLRRYYLSKGYAMYSFEKMMVSLARSVKDILNNENKERSYDMIQLFYKDRKKETTTHQDEVAYRKQVEKYVKEGDIYRIAYSPTKSIATVRLMKRDDNTFDPNGPEVEWAYGTLTLEDRWRQYVESFRRIDRTEGLPLYDLQPTLLARSVRRASARTERAIEKLKESRPEGAPPLPNLKTIEWRASQLDISPNDLWLRINPVTYRIRYGDSEEDTRRDDHNEEGWISRSFLRSLGQKQDAASKSIARREGAEAGEKASTEDDAHAAFLEKFVMNSTWMKGKTREEVDARNREYREWTDGGPSREKEEDDVVMVD